MEGMDAFQAANPEKLKSLMEYIGQREQEGMFRDVQLAAVS
jgi:hypothetical protein